MADMIKQDQSADHVQQDISTQVAAIVIGRNEGDRLVRCLNSLSQLGIPVIYVDSASTDGSAEKAKEMGALVHDLDLNRPFTAARARNKGLEHLERSNIDANFVQFVDGDCEVELTWVPEALKFLQDREDVAVVCGRRRERFPEQSIYNLQCDREWNTPVGEAESCGGDALMRRSVFNAVGGYDQTLIAGEEPDLCRRIREKGHLIWRLETPMTIHDAAMLQFRQWWMRAVRSGFGYAQVWWTTRKSADPLYGRELARSVFWAALLPLAVLMLMLINPAFISLLPIAYILQITRMAIRDGGVSTTSWKLAALNLIGKFAELTGAIRFVLRLIQRKPGGTILYK